MFGTCLQAVAASNALIGVHSYLRKAFIGFGIAAPLTPQRTALQEELRPNPGAIVYGLTLYIYHIGKLFGRIFYQIYSVDHFVFVHVFTSNLD